ncbi:hypothetical protein [Rhizobium tibeticum]|uniref:hypothetical protein n=1 Tax=Rhizobium tibeticum TaxID=501024 RepID=UPI000ADAE141|nr:hypothetical protein [Rhizobium tibeticum]
MRKAPRSACDPKDASQHREECCKNQCKSDEDPEIVCAIERNFVLLDGALGLGKAVRPAERKPSVIGRGNQTHAGEAAPARPHRISMPSASV